QRVEGREPVEPGAGDPAVQQEHGGAPGGCLQPADEGGAPARQLEPLPQRQGRTDRCRLLGTELGRGGHAVNLRSGRWHGWTWGRSTRCWRALGETSTRASCPPASSPWASTARWSCTK